MCGINLAVALGTTTLGGFGSRTFGAMHFANQLRGVDAAGIFCRKGSEVTYYKDVGPASAQRRASDYVSLLTGARFAVGHTRAATMGGADEPEAAHPFNPPSIVGVHNGTVRGYKTYFKEAKDPINDSEAFFQAISAVPPEEAVDVLGRIYSGAFALVWYDMRVDELRIARNDERPFWMTEYTTSAGSFLLGASQPGYIAMAVAHATDKPEEYLNVKAWELSVGKMLSISFKTGETTVTDFKMPTYSASDWTSKNIDYEADWRARQAAAAYYTPYYDRYSRRDYPTTSRAPWYGNENANSYDVYEGNKKRTVVFDHVSRKWLDKEEEE